MKPVYSCRTCSEHAGVGVRGGQAHVLLQAAARPLQGALQGQRLGLGGGGPHGAALLVHRPHRAVQGGLQRLQLGGGLPQEEPRHELTHHRGALVLLRGEEGEEEEEEEEEEEVVEEEEGGKKRGRGWRRKRRFSWFTFLLLTNISTHR